MWVQDRYKTKARCNVEVKLKYETSFKFEVECKLDRLLPTVNFNKYGPYLTSASGNLYCGRQGKLLLGWNKKREGFVLCFCFLAVEEVGIQIGGKPPVFVVCCDCIQLDRRLTLSIRLLSCNIK